jgi:membrane peptidoglycan carboxypeptidase
MSASHAGVGRTLVCVPKPRFPGKRPRFSGGNQKPSFLSQHKFLDKASVITRLAVAAVVGGALVAGVALPAVGGIGSVMRNAANKFNTLSTPELHQLPVRSELLDRSGKVLAYYYPRGIDRVPVSYSQISPEMRTAIVAIEDSRFYQHGAIDFRGTIRALINDLEHKPIQGGSTLAQQYVKNVEILSAPNPQQAFASATQETIGRKIRELRMAVRAEHTMSKDDILAGYLNVAFFGNEAYGVEVAAERYFSTTAGKLTLPQAALLAGVVEDPTKYDPVLHPANALARRNVVLARMYQLHDISYATERAALKAPLGLNQSIPQSGCTSKSARYAAYLCDYVVAVIKHDSAYKKVWARLNGSGGLIITTTLDPQDQKAADHAVDHILPPPPSRFNPGQNADTEVLIQPGTGKVRAIAIDRRYGVGPGQNIVDYAVGPQYDGTGGVQIGSTGKVYTMVTALEQGVPFGYSKTVGFSASVGGFTNCEGHYLAPWSLHNDESERGGHYTLYTGTTFSINVFFAYLEQKVGLCNVVRTAAKMGLTWPDGKSLLKPDRREGHPYSADNDPSFTLGADDVTPMGVAAADATLPARGIFCSPIAITKIVTMTGTNLPVESAHCHRVLSQTVADGANYILQGDLTGLGTAASDAIPRPAASKTGTADNYMSAFFVGYTPDLLGAVWVGNPTNPQTHPMLGYPGSCYRPAGSDTQYCPGSMYGSMAPGNTWMITFLRAALAHPPHNFVPVPQGSPLFSQGNGIVSPTPPAPTHHPVPPPHHPGPGGGHNGGGGGGGGHGGGGGGH